MTNLLHSSFTSGQKSCKIEVYMYVRRLIAFHKTNLQEVTMLDLTTLTSSLMTNMVDILVYAAVAIVTLIGVFKRKRWSY